MGGCAEAKIGGALLLAQADCTPASMMDALALIALALVLTLILQQGGAR